MTDVDTFREKWAESNVIGHEAEAALGREKYAKEVQGKAIPDQSTGLFGERDALRAECKAIAIAYCAANEAELQPLYGGLLIEHLVPLITVARARGNADEATIIDMWLLAKFEPQRIRGNFRAPAPGR